MKFTLNWLKDYIDFDLSPEELSHKLTMAGLEVEDVIYQGKGLENVIAAQITELTPHPDAEKLSLCKVTDGENTYPIVCGANNMKAGDKVALAKIGAKLPPGPKFEDGLKIKKAKIRGEVSEGMLCAENELGLGEESDGIIILPQSANVGKAIVDELGINDVIFEVGITPNRPDCLSVIGVAREVAALTGNRVKHPDSKISEEGEEINNIAKVELLDPGKCPRYSCRVIKNVKIGPSPAWLKRRLEASDIRSINNVVDITNFILLEYGQPLHAFDYDLLEGNKIVVRAAKNGETITTLDNIERKLADSDLLICDGKKPIALAGVMGGANTEVSESTTNVLLESAYFDPTTVRKTSKSTGLRSESSYRFERGINPNGVTNALNRAAELIRELGDGEIAKGLIDEYPSIIEPAEVKISLDRANKFLGTNINSDELIKIANGLEFENLGSDKNDFTFRIPTFRVDITREIDLIEEAARLHGYDNIPTTLPAVRMKSDNVNINKLVQDKFKEVFISAGFNEVINYSFEDHELLSLINKTQALKILNPLTTESSAMRTSLIPGLLKNAVLNLNHQQENLRLFEIGKVYIPIENKELPNEIRKIAATATGTRMPEFWGKKEFDFFDFKSILEKGFESLMIWDDVVFQDAQEIEFLHPGKSAMLVIDDEDIGYVGEIHPNLSEKLDISKGLYLLEIDLDKIASLSRKKKKTFKPLPKFPSVRRDIALIIDESIPVGGILEEIGKSGSSLIENAAIFDVYTGDNVEEGKKSVAVSLQLRAKDKTLTEEEINKAQEKTLKKLGLALGAELRTI
ncbi:MAG: phenylalanine--tRNA ligase beta subunit [Thermodesulfobacteriota bacterium]|nr:MAG: phenylalanine--tRNA ligase beta subunit [Thermodesulfobacteriota bacterium]